MELKLTIQLDDNSARLIAAAIVGYTERLSEYAKTEMAGQVAAPAQPAPTVAAPINTTVLGLPVAPPVNAAPAQQVNGVPVEAPKYSYEDLARASMPVRDAKGSACLAGILRELGVSALTELPPEKYATYAATLREHGGKL